MAAPARDLIVNLVGKTNQLMGPLQGAAGQLSSLGGTLTKTLTPAAAALGAGMAVAGNEFNKGVDALRVGAGATGDALDAMSSSMTNVANNASVARLGVGRIGEIMADVNTTTGATGGTLETLTTRFAQLERMGLGGSVTDINRVFGDWGITTENMTGTMDQLFRAAQASGATIDDLSGKVVQFGAPLRNLGFGFEESTALIASFEKNGVNLETVMGGLRQGIGKLAKAGEDVPDTFRRVVGEIENAEDASEATRLAIELFGQRAGPDLADAIQNGQFAVEDMLKAIEDGEDTIDDAAKDTTRLGDQFAALKNRLVGFLGPFGEIGAVAGGAMAALGPMMMGMGQLGPLLGSVGRAFAGLTTIMMANPFVLIAAAVIALGTIIFFHRDKVLGALRKAWEVLKDVAGKIWDAIGGFVETTFDLIKDIFLNFTPLGQLIQNWETVQEAIETVWAAIQTAIDTAVGVIEGVLGTFGSAVAAVRNFIQDRVDDIVGFFTALPGRLTEQIRKLATTAWEWFRSGVTGLKNWISDRVDDIVGFFTGLPGRVAAVISGIAETIKSPFVNAFDAIKSAWNSTVGGFGFQVPGWVPGVGGKSFRIPPMATGGIVTGPTLAMIGEGQGPEAVVPLDRLERWIETLASSQQRQGGTIVVPVHLDGRVIAEVVAEADMRSGGVILQHVGQ